MTLGHELKLKAMVDMKNLGYQPRALDVMKSDYYQKVLFCRPNYNGFKHL